MPFKRSMLLIVLIQGLAIFGLAGVRSAAATVSNGLIAYASYEDGDYDIYIMNEDGTNVRNLTTAFDGASGFDDLNPAWSPDGTRIAFDSTRVDNGGSAVYVTDADGSNQVQLTSPAPFESHFGPAWAPDAGKISFTNAGEGDWDIWVMNPNGSGQTDITSPNQTLAYDDYGASWAPDGTRIVFTGIRDGGQEILSTKPDGTDEINLTADEDPPYATINHFASYRPDGSVLVYMSQPNDGSNEWDIWTMNPDGSNKVDILPDEDWEDLFPTWSPDGNQITFVSNRSEFGTDVYVMDYPPQASGQVASGAGKASATGVAVLPLTANGTTTRADWQPVPRFTAILTPGSVVPGPGDADGRGGAVVAVAGNKLCYAIRVENLNLPATGAKLYRGAAGQTGPAVATFTPPSAAGTSRGCLSAVPASILRDVALHPTRYYVQIMTAGYPGGAVRGQLR